MNIICCTQKLQKEMGLKPKDLLNDSMLESILGFWHANLLHINRRKCILFVNDKTLFNFLVPDVDRQRIKELGTLFNNNFECLLSEEGFTKSVIDQIISECSTTAYSKTKSKSILGSMNDLALHYKYHVMESGGVHSFEIPSIIAKLNRMPMGAIKYSYPIEKLKETIEKQ